MNTVTVNIYKNPDLPSPSHQLLNIPWFAGITALQAMIIGEAMYESNFSFRLVYRSLFGAFVDAIDGVEDDPANQRFWMLYINGTESTVGASEAVIAEDETTTSATVEWRYVQVGSQPSAQVTLKTKDLPRTN